MTILQENSFGALNLVFSYDKQSGSEILKIEGEVFRHLFMVRRSKGRELFVFSNLTDDTVYEYEVVQIDKKSATLRLAGFKEYKSKSSKCEIAWCVVDSKTIEKTIPMLNELGIGTIYFIYSDRSQKNFKIDFERLTKIAINSSCQCGQNSLMRFVVFSSLAEFCEQKSDFFAFDFGGESIGETRSGLFLVGPEGGFCTAEKELIGQKAKKILSFNANSVLKSETAVVAAALLGVI